MDEDELADEVFERELEAMAGYGSDEENPETFAALHKRLAAQRREEAATGACEYACECACMGARLRQSQSKVPIYPLP